MFLGLRCDLSLLLQLLLQLLDQVVFVIVQQRQVLNVHVGVFELFLEVEDLALLLVHDEELGVDVLRRQVGNLRGPARIVQRAQVLLEVLVGGRQARDHERVRVATQALLQQAR